MTVTIDRFDGEHLFLSPLYEASFTVLGVDYQSLEHYVQAHRAPDSETSARIRQCRSAIQARRIGLSVTPRPDWPLVRDGVMLVGLRHKFKDPDLAKRLLETGDALLVHGNLWHDNYWGVCQCDRCQGVASLNMLGRLLMALRYEIQSQHSN